MLLKARFHLIYSLFTEALYTHTGAAEVNAIILDDSVASDARAKLPQRVLYVSMCVWSTVHELHPHIPDAMSRCRLM